MINALILILLSACVASVVSHYAAREIAMEVCPVCGSVDVLEINGHIICGNCGTMLAGCCEGPMGPQ